MLTLGFASTGSAKVKTMGDRPSPKSNSLTRASKTRVCPPRHSRIKVDKQRAVCHLITLDSSLPPRDSRPKCRPPLSIRGRSVRRCYLLDVCDPWTYGSRYVSSETRRLDFDNGRPQYYGYTTCEFSKRKGLQWTLDLIKPDPSNVKIRVKKRYFRSLGTKRRGIESFAGKCFKEPH